MIGRVVAANTSSEDIQIALRVDLLVAFIAATAGAMVTQSTANVILFYYVVLQIYSQHSFIK